MQAEVLGHNGRNMTANAIVEATDLREAQLAWAKQRPAKVARRSGHSPSTEIGHVQLEGRPTPFAQQDGQASSPGLDTLRQALRLNFELGCFPLPPLCDNKTTAQGELYPRGPTAD